MNRATITATMAPKYDVRQVALCYSHSYALVGMPYQYNGLHTGDDRNHTHQGT